MTFGAGVVWIVGLPEFVVGIAVGEEVITGAEELVLAVELDGLFVEGWEVDPIDDGDTGDIEGTGDARDPEGLAGSGSPCTTTTSPGFNSPSETLVSVPFITV